MTVTARTTKTDIEDTTSTSTQVSQKDFHSHPLLAGVSALACIRSFLVVTVVTVLR